ncbi:MAG: type II/IV secretion system protein [Sedimentisphaerales bacterium]|nr:type II/IV secretion system protein [Sedimentisphaerales bacterium]
MAAAVRSGLPFSPYRLGFIVFWFYLGIYMAFRFRAHPLTPKDYKQLSNLLMLFGGPFYLFILFMVHVVRTAEMKKMSLFKAFKLSLKTHGVSVVNRKYAGARGSESTVLIDASGRSLSEAYGSKRNHKDMEILQIVEGIIHDSIEQLATDILINPIDPMKFNIRFRVDGYLRTICEMDAPTCTAVVNSLKVISGMDITEKRRPQDGGFVAQTSDGTISFRSASAGVLHGEKLSIRVLNQNIAPLSIKDLGYNESQLKVINATIQRQSGMVMVCGPTGSGKTTSLYGMLRQIDFSQRNVITIEDPIEYVLPQVSQIEINPKADITFASVLRSVLRQDPDVICVGEIRDEETATIALQASQTGHLVFATLHSNSNRSALVRLIDLGIKPMLLASGLDVIISQRLIRRLCPVCKRSANLSDTQITRLQSKGLDPSAVMEPRGCKECGWTGYRGRTGIFDVTVLDDTIKSQLLSSNLSLSEFRTDGKGLGRNNMEKQGIRLALAGITSLKEVKRVISNVG